MVFSPRVDEEHETSSELVFIESARMGFSHFALAFQGLSALWENDPPHCLLCVCLDRHLLSIPQKSALCLLLLLQDDLFFQPHFLWP